MKRSFAIGVITIFLFTLLGSFVSFADEKDFTVYFKDLNVNNDFGDIIGDVRGVTPNNGDGKELQVLYRAFPTHESSSEPKVYYTEASANRFVEGTFSVGSDGTYSISFTFLADTTNGIFQVSIDGICVGRPFDTNNAANNVDTWNMVTVNLGNISLKAGEHKIKIICLGMSGSNNYSLGYFYSMDFEYKGAYEENYILTFDTEDVDLTGVNGALMTDDIWPGHVYSINIPAEKSYSFDVNIEKAGKYYVNLSYLADWNCAVVDILIDGTVAGTANMYKKQSTNWALLEKCIAELSLTAGKHTVTVSYNQEASALNTQTQQSDLAQCYIDSISFRAIELEPENQGGDEPDTPPAGGDVGGGSGEGSGSGGSSEGGSGEGTGGAQKPPVTGDNSAIILLVSLTCIAFGVLTIKRKVAD